MEKPELSDSWIYDLTRDTMTRVTFEVNQNKASMTTPAIWTPDGQHVTFGSRREEDSQMQIYGMSADGSGQTERLTPSGDRYRTTNSWSPDGKVLAFTQIGFGNLDIWTLSLQNEPQLQPILQTDFWELHAMFSPDGRWIAYTSNESGQSEVYVRPYPGPGEKIQISTQGGVQPVWARDGRELFYSQGEGFTSSGNPLMVVPVETGATFVAGQPAEVLEGTYDMGLGFSSNYDVSPDGKSFFMIKRTTEPPREIHVVLNWFEELKRLSPRN
jgi:Tol biopolymer transport system component